MQTNDKDIKLLAAWNEWCMSKDNTNLLSIELQRLLEYQI